MKTRSRSYVFRLTVLAMMVSAEVGCIMAAPRNNTIADRIDSLNVRVDNIEREAAFMKKEQQIVDKSLHRIDEHTEKNYAAVSNQIASSSHIISAWGIAISVLSAFLTLFGIAFGYYINRMWKKINEMQQNATQLMSDWDRKMAEISEEQQRVSATQGEIVKLQNKINTDAAQIDKNLQEGEKQLETLQELYGNFRENSSKIYTHLRREETKYLLTRLEEIPEDIANICDSLLSRTLEASDFAYVLNGYHNLIQRYLDMTQMKSVQELRLANSSFRKKEDLYLIVFAQHFLRQAILEDDLREVIRNGFARLISCYYKNDAEQSTKDLKAGVAQLEPDLRMSILKDYTKALSESKFANFKELYEILVGDMEMDEMISLWDRVIGEEKNAICFTEVCLAILLQNRPESDKIEPMQKYITDAQAQH